MPCHAQVTNMTFRSAPDRKTAQERARYTANAAVCKLNQQWTLSCSRRFALKHRRHLAGVNVAAT